MMGWIACREEQEHAQSRVHADDHLEVLGSPAAVPGPPRRPEDGQRVDPEGEDEADDAECELQEFLAIRCSHGRAPQVWAAESYAAFWGRRPADHSPWLRTRMRRAFRNVSSNSGSPPASLTSWSRSSIAPSRRISTCGRSPPACGGSAC